MAISAPARSTYFKPSRRPKAALRRTSALGSLSLIFWTLIVVVSLKYALVVMRADNHGEGGILALMSLTRAKWHGRNSYLIAFGLIGAALLYGDGMITPAISVLSAVEGLKLASQDFARYTMPIAAVVLLLLFVVQRYRHRRRRPRVRAGDAAVVHLVIAILGAIGIGRAPHVIVAVNPLYAAAFLIHHGVASLAVLGAVFLCVTGAEAMYADMGHLGREPIRVAWTVIVLPALLLNYAGQTAVVLQTRGGDANPFFVLAPDLAALPDDRAGDARHRHRQPGDHHRLVLAHAAGDAARLAAGHAHQSDVVGTVRPDLRAVRELADDGGNGGADGDI